MVDSKSKYSVNCQHPEDMQRFQHSAIGLILRPYRKSKSAELFDSSAARCWRHNCGMTVAWTQSWYSPEQSLLLDGEDTSLVNTSQEPFCAWCHVVDPWTLRFHYASKCISVSTHNWWSTPTTRTVRLLVFCSGQCNCRFWADLLDL